MHWYFHRSIWAYEGRRVLWSGGATWLPLQWKVGETTYQWRGDEVPGVDGFVWYSCRL
jgi:hypothetical protein